MPSRNAVDCLVDQLLVDRPTLSLAERVEARRAIDQARGITYTPPAPSELHQLARLTASGLRRAHQPAEQRLAS